MDRLKCPNCGKLFTTNRTDKKFCCSACTREYDVKRKALRRSEQRVIPELTCSMCGKKFFPHKITHKTQKYCSEECRMIAYYQRRKEKGRTEEHRKYYKKNQSKVNELNKKARRRRAYEGNMLKALERDGYKCTECGSSKNLSVHHKDFSGQTNNPNHKLSNLVTLCKKCHGKLHFNDYMKDNRPHNYKDIPKEAIVEALNNTETVEKAAKYLGITRKTLLDKRRQYDLPLKRQYKT